jgi:predicted DNA-binding transcriptional regulator AlpA
MNAWGFYLRRFLLWDLNPALAFSSEAVRNNGTKAMSSFADIEALQQKAEGAAFIGIARVRELSGFSKSTILRKIKDGDFPAPVISGGNCVRWDLAEVMSWRAAQFKARDERNAQKPKPEARA